MWHSHSGGGDAIAVLPAPALTPTLSREREREHTSGSRPRRVGYFRLIVVFTPSLTVASSNQRAVTVLVCV
ncbi:protein of unknown function (plasmid) [Cupriavidus neocaledonicus]|uniref:Uncharacterized protein n=1 Tax=Cupriavidus neocaledonicus TaxID=1040979 RepID=A0A375HRI5_9BURK|nr:hypothetical protein CBM2605_B100268 [Cupriavidus neocaledonicus]SPD60045.1 protein of unknown function [Cupriavidus neocaledonicus]